MRYLGFILDRKLSWKRNIEDGSRKAIMGVYASKTAKGKKWETGELLSIPTKSLEMIINLPLVDQYGKCLAG